MHHGYIQVLIILMALLLPAGVFGQDPGMVADSSADFLKGNAYGAQVAATPPAIEFGLVQLTRYGDEFGHWGNVVQGPDGKFYFGLGNHQDGDGGGRSLLVAYDPDTRRDEILMYSIDVLGHKEGKWHGRPDIDPANGDMYIQGFFVGDLIHYNIYSRKITVVGKPVEGTQLPEHIWDWERERLYATTQNDDGTAKGDLLVYDTRNRQVIFYGRPVDSQTAALLHWDNRTRCLDRETGCLYGTDTNTKHLIRYDPGTNTFLRLNSRLQGQLRAWTNMKDPDGKFWIFDDVGNIYTFYPDQDLVAYQGKNWVTGCYVSFLEKSPGGRYLYYSIAQSGAGAKYGMPIIQYDTRTNQKKAIAFLHEFYKKNYNYTSDKIYGGALNQEGSCFFVALNGKLGETRRQSMLYIHIPESERMEDHSAVGPRRPAMAVPSGYILDANFPNPFNQTTIISYQISVVSKVELCVYDLLGQQIATLVNGELNPGLYQIAWNAQNEASGIYFCRIAVNGQVSMRKMTLVR